MAKIIIKKESINEKNERKKESRYLLVEDENKDFHSHLGIIPASVLKKGGRYKTKSAEVVIIKPTFLDRFKRLERSAQTINLKDLGYILINCSITKNSIVIDAGTGSSASACYSAAIAKRVYSYDVDERRIDIAKKNAQKLGLKNIIFEKKDIYQQKAKVKNADIFILDVTEPWRAFDFVRDSLKIGGYVAIYSPCITQVIKTKERFKTSFIYEKSVEIMERFWKVEGEVVRPDNTPIGHSAFISFFRRIE